MGPEDIASLFFGDEASGPQKAMQLAQALRGQQQLGTLGMLTGDHVLGNVGQHMLQGVGDREALIAKAGTQQNAQRLQLAMAKQEQDAALARERYSQGEQDSRQRAALNAGKYVQGPFGVLDTRTGELDPYSKPAAGLKPKDLEEGFEKLTKAISTTQGRGNLNVEQQKRLNASDRIKAIAMNPDGTPADLTPQMMTELAAASAGLITGGSPAEHTIQQMTPSSVGSDWAKIQQWLTNAPAGAGQRAFVQQMLSQAKREEDTIKPQILSGQMQSLPAFSHLRKADQKRFESVLKANGIDPATVDENGLAIAKQAAGSGGAPPREGMVRIRDPKSGRTGWAPKDKIPAGVEVVPG